MKDKRTIVIRFNSANEYLVFQEAIKEFRKYKKFANKNEAYLFLIKSGMTKQKVKENKDQEASLKNIEDLLTLTEA